MEDGVGIDVCVRGRRPSLCTKPKRRERKKPSIPIDELARRWEAGEDLWDSRPLTGKDADDWLKIQFGEAPDENDPTPDVDPMGMTELIEALVNAA